MAAVTACVADMAGMVTVVLFGIKLFNEVNLDFIHNFWGVIFLIVAAVTACVAIMAGMVTVILFGIKLFNDVSLYLI